MRVSPPPTDRLIVPILVLLLVTVPLAGSVAAAPNIWAVSADLAHDEALVGERVPVEVHMKNTGDGGTTTIEVKRNGSVRASERISMDGNAEKNVEIPIRINNTGYYKISVDDGAGSVRAGYLTVSNVRTASVSERSDGRTVRFRAGTVESNTSVVASAPAAPNSSFTLESVTMTSSGAPFNRSVATYAPAGNASFAIPGGEGSTVIGAVDMDSLDGVSTANVRLAVDRALIRDRDLETEDVVVYRRGSDGFEPVSTAQVDTTAEAVVYEATTDGGDQFVVGSLVPAFSVSSNEISTRSTDDGKRINLTASVTNDGPAAGDFDATMQVNGETVDRQTVTVGADQTKRIRLQHTVTDQGDYDVGFGNQSVGSVVLTGDDPASEDAPEDDGTTGGGPVPALPETDDVGLVQIGIGAAIVLFGGALVLFRRR